MLAEQIHKHRVSADSPPGMCVSGRRDEEAFLWLYTEETQNNLKADKQPRQLWWRLLPGFTL